MEDEAAGTGSIDRKRAFGVDGNGGDPEVVGSLAVGVEDGGGFATGEEGMKVEGDAAGLGGDSGDKPLVVGTPGEENPLAGMTAEKAGFLPGGGAGLEKGPGRTLAEGPMVAAVVDKAGLEENEEGDILGGGDKASGAWVEHERGFVHGSGDVARKGKEAEMAGVRAERMAGGILGVVLVPLVSLDRFSGNEVGPGAAVADGLGNAVEIDEEPVAGTETQGADDIVLNLLNVIVDKVDLHTGDAPCGDFLKDGLGLLKGLEALVFIPEDDLDALTSGIFEDFGDPELLEFMPADIEAEVFPAGLAGEVDIGFHPLESPVAPLMIGEPGPGDAPGAHPIEIAGDRGVGEALDGGGLDDGREIRGEESNPPGGAAHSGNRMVGAVGLVVLEVDAPASIAAKMGGTIGGAIGLGEGAFTEPGPAPAGVQFEEEGHEPWNRFHLRKGADFLHALVVLAVLDPVGPDVSMLLPVTAEDGSKVHPGRFPGDCYGLMEAESEGHSFGENQKLDREGKSVFFKGEREDGGPVAVLPGFPRGQGESLVAYGLRASGQPQAGSEVRAPGEKDADGSWMD